jgi:5-methylcytosine-specific restriction protein A
VSKKLRPACKVKVCPNRALEGSSYCAEHQKIAQKRRKESDRQYDRKRGWQDHNYSSVKWRRIRAYKLKQSPLCEMCLKQGKIVPAKIIHHIIPRKDGGTDDFDNLMSLCHYCHNKIHHGKGG